MCAHAVIVTDLGGERAELMDGQHHGLEAVIDFSARSDLE